LVTQSDQRLNCAVFLVRLIKKSSKLKLEMAASISLRWQKRISDSEVRIN
jgi:hypothetical protein